MDISASQGGWRWEAQAGQQKLPASVLPPPPASLVHSFPFSLCPTQSLSHSPVSCSLSISPSLSDRALNLRVNAYAVVIAHILTHYSLLGFSSCASTCLKVSQADAARLQDCGNFFFVVSDVICRISHSEMKVMLTLKWIFFFFLQQGKI